MGRSVDNVSVCVGLEERRGSPRSWVPLLLMLEDLDRESLECFCVQNFCKLEGGGVPEGDASTANSPKVSNE